MKLFQYQVIFNGIRFHLKQTNNSREAKKIENFFPGPGKSEVFFKKRSNSCWIRFRPKNRIFKIQNGERVGGNLAGWRLGAKEAFGAPYPADPGLNISRVIFFRMVLLWHEIPKIWRQSFGSYDKSPPSMSSYTSVFMHPQSGYKALAICALGRINTRAGRHWLWSKWGLRQNVGPCRFKMQPLLWRAHIEARAQAEAISIGPSFVSAA